jgi:hypothetical protein
MTDSERRGHRTRRACNPALQLSLNGYLAQALDELLDHLPPLAQLGSDIAVIGVVDLRRQFLPFLPQEFQQKQPLRISERKGILHGRSSWHAGRPPNNENNWPSQDSMPGDGAPSLRVAGLCGSDGVQCSDSELRLLSKETRRASVIHTGRAD